jgi:hypothetical protein
MNFHALAASYNNRFLPLISKRMMFQSTPDLSSEKAIDRSVACISVNEELAKNDNMLTHVDTIELSPQGEGFRL